MDNYSKLTEQNINPRIVFFSGGTSLRELSREITKYTCNSIHLITVFDSGGSSAALRKSFDMPAIGDLRNRLLALADLSIVPKSVIEICNLRLPRSGIFPELINTLHNISSDAYPLWLDIPALWGDRMRFYLGYFLKKMPADFDPCYASIGNLMLVGAYLYHDKRIESIIDLFSQVLRIKGIVVPIVGDNLHLVAVLDKKNFIFGQHNITAKDNATTTKSITELFLTKTKLYSTPINYVSSSLEQGQNNALETIKLEHLAPYTPRLSAEIIMHLSTADLICYPMGSFYTSIIANLLPVKVGHSIANAKCSKIYIPNVGYDSEQANMSVAQAVQIMLKYLRKDAGENTATNKLLNKVIIDSKHGLYAGGIDFEGIKALGIEIYDVSLIANDNSLHDAKLTVEALLSCCNNKCI